MKSIKNGDTVTVNYTGKLEDGSVFDSSLTEGREPLTAKLGEQQLIPGFEAGLIGMSDGDKKTITIESADAYGDYNDKMVIEVPINHLPDGVQEGMTLQVNTPYGPQPVHVKVLDKEKGIAHIDHNHPLAGQRLIFDLEVVSFDSGIEEAVIISETREN